MASRRSTKLIVVHVSATPPSMDIGVEEIDKMHKDRGWSGCGYAEVIRRDGTLEIGRGHKAIGAHVKGFNSISFGICLIGGVDARGRPQNNATPAQLAALEKRLRYHTRNYSQAKICGHRDLSPDKDGDGIVEPHEHLKACPCFNVIPWARSKDLPVADIRGNWDKGTVRYPRAPDKRLVYLQTILRKAGYEFGPIDGLIGSKTTDAIRRFQSAAAIRVNGTFDKPTVARLRAMAEVPAKIKTVTIIKHKTKHILPPEIVKSKSDGIAAVAVLAGAGFLAVVSGFFSKIQDFIGGI